MKKVIINEISIDNYRFYREAIRANSIEQINESEGMKYLAEEEIQSMENFILLELKRYITISFILSDCGKFSIKAEFDTNKEVNE